MSAPGMRSVTLASQPPTRLIPRPLLCFLRPVLHSRRSSPLHVALLPSQGQAYLLNLAYLPIAAADPPPCGPTSPRRTLLYRPSGATRTCVRATGRSRPISTRSFCRPSPRDTR
eukprot:Mycagemm_TRINITY_DN10297_c0_g2::TRINITY_DN10297_c0_g2_i2::g.3821::m.3821 type:complete len:114 gc:universal TRINITY_DN10297_c0_g2_i2:526-867(+)